SVANQDQTRMDNIRFALLCALGALAFLLYQAWQADYGTNPPAQSQVQTSTDTGQGSDVPATDTASAAAAAGSGTATGMAVSVKAAAGGSDKELTEGKIILVVTDKLNVSIDTRGGDLRLVELRQVPVAADKPKSMLNLVNDS